MLTSPITVTINGVAHSLSRINQDNFSSSYLKTATNLEIQMNIRHSREGKAGPGQMERHNVELIYITYDAVTGVPTTRSTYAVIRHPRGADPAVSGHIAQGLVDFVGANEGPLIAWES